MFDAAIAPAADFLDLQAVADKAARAIPPAWPLASSVAVNPFLGQTGEPLEQVGARLARVAGVPVGPVGAGDHERHGVPLGLLLVGVKYPFCLLGLAAKGIYQRCYRAGDAGATLGFIWTKSTPD